MSSETYVYFNPEYQTKGGKKHNRELICQYSIGPHKVAKCNFNMVGETTLQIEVVHNSFKYYIWTRTDRVLFHKPLSQPLENLL